MVTRSSIGIVEKDMTKRLEKKMVEGLDGRRSDGVEES